MSADTLMSRLPDILDDLREVQQFFSVWREYTDPRNRTTFEPVMHAYPVFFDSLVRAHFAGLIVSLYCLYDGDRTTNSLRRLYSEASLENVLTDAAVRTTLRLHTEIDKSWQKVCILRSNVFSHRSSKISPSEAFRKARITPDELAAMIKMAQRLFNCISRSLTGSSHVFRITAKKDITKLMRNLYKSAL